MKLALKFVGAACLCMLSLPLFAASADQPLTLISTTPLPDVTGGDFDHFAVDLKHGKMFVSAEKYASIEAFSLPDGQHLASHLNIAKAPHKILLSDDGRKLYIADAGDANLKVVGTDGFNLERTIPMVPQPDTGVVDRKHQIFYLGNGGAQSHQDHAYISMVSLANDRVLGRIDVPAAQLKAMVIDHKTHRLFVNMREKDQIGVIDLKTHKLAAIWDVPGPSLNSAMAFDPESRRLFIGSRAPGKLIVMDADTGEIVQTLPTVDVSDDMTFDEAHHRLYVTGTGGLDVFNQIDKNHYALQEHIDTLGGKTSVYIPSLKRFYVVHTKGPQASEAGLQIFAVH